MRILDRLLAGEVINPVRDSLSPPAEAIRAAQPLQVDNVAEYVFRNVKVGDVWDLTADFPNIAPPFEWAWYEFRRPPHIASIAKWKDSTPENTPGLPDHMGVLVEAQRTDTGWTTRYYCYSATGKDPIKGAITFQVDCDAEGRVGPGDMINVLVNRNRSDFERYSNFLWNAGSDLLVPIFMATSLLHSKNVTIEREPPIDGPLQRQHRKKYGTERVRFHLLHIEPMRKVLRSAGAEDPETGIKQAMHMVRGHFKDYREGRGLFGRYQGLYWWDQHVAGRLEEGLVRKTYVVHASRRDAPG